MSLADPRSTYALLLHCPGTLPSPPAPSLWFLYSRLRLALMPYDLLGLLSADSLLCYTQLHVFLVRDTFVNARRFPSLETHSQASRSLIVFSRLFRPSGMPALSLFLPTLHFMAPGSLARTMENPGVSQIGTLLAVFSAFFMSQVVYAVNVMAAAVPEGKELEA